MGVKKAQYRQCTRQYIASTEKHCKIRIIRSHSTQNRPSWLAALHHAVCSPYSPAHVEYCVTYNQEYIPPPPPQSVQCLIQLCIRYWSSIVGSSDVMRTLHKSARQGTVVFDPRVPVTPRVPLRCVRYYDAKTGYQYSLCVQVR